MVQRRDSARLVEQPRVLGGARPRAGLAHHFDGDGALQPRVVRAIDDAHAAGAKAGIDGVVREGLADQCTVE